MSFSIKPKPEGESGDNTAGTSNVPQQHQYVTQRTAAAPVLLYVGLGICLTLLAVLGYSASTTRTALEERISSLEQQLRTEIQTVRNEGNQLAGEMKVVSNRIGVTAGELDQARRYSERLKRDQEAAAERLANELATKANTQDVAQVRQEAQSTATRVAEVQKEADAKIGNVSGEVKAVAQDLTATKQDLAQSKRDLVDVRNNLGQQIARNSSELSDLRKKGERDYFEFDIRKGRKNEGQRVADIALELRKADQKKQRYDVVIMVDDNRLEKKDRTANEPVQFLVGKDKLRYEVVVNSVDKDRIRGYVSAPKDRALSAERPAFRTPQ